MQGRKRTPQAGLFLYQDPYQKLPQSQFWKALETQLGDLEWVREATVHLYAAGTGRPSLDPVVFLKAMLAGFFLNCVTDSELAFRLADSLTLRRFLGYGLDEETPERTTLLKTRQRWPVEVFEQVFRRVLQQLAEAGLVPGEHLSTDTVLVEANASMDSLRHREQGCPYSAYVKALYSQPGETPAPSELARQDATRPKKASNQDWVSGTDPEAAVAVHPDGHTALSYRVDGTMDTETGALVQIGVAPGSVRDSEDLPQRAAEAQANLEALGLQPETLTADRGHHSEENLVEVAELGLTPIVRERSQRGAPGFRPRDFVYVPERDVYQCPAGQELHRRGAAEGGRGGRYGTRAGVCPACPHYGVCTKAKEGRVLRRAEHEADLEANRQRLQSLEGSLLLRAHRQRAEGPWSYAKLYGGLARLGTRGLASAWKQVLVLGIGWNLLLLIAQRTGWTPRGGSVRRGAPTPVPGGVGTPVSGRMLLRRALSLVVELARACRLRSWPPHTRPRPHLQWRGRGLKKALSQGC
jgi:transposase